MGRDLYNVQQVYIDVSLGKGDNRSSLSWKSGAPDYFTSLSHKRFTSQANEATINLTYAPQPDDDPNYIENLLVKHKGVVTYQYGRVGEVSHSYLGRVNEYSTNCQEGVLSYTLNIVSQAVIYNFSKITKKMMQGKIFGAHELLSYDKWNTYGGRIPTEEDKQKMNVGSSYADYVLNYLSVIVSASEMGDKYEFDKEGSTCSIKNNFKGYDVIDKTPMKALQEIAAGLVDKEDSNKYFYKIIVDDSYSGNSKGKIRLVRSASTNSTPRFVFEWGDEDCDILSWKPKYNGSVLMFSNNEKQETATITETEDGKVVGNSYEVPQAINDADPLDYYNDDTLQESLVRNINWFEEHKGYSYEAELEVLGFVEDLTLSQSVVEVIPLVNGKPHLSQGLYLVNGITDKVDSRGFTTVLSLQKYNPSSLSKEDGKYYITKDDGTKVEVRDHIV